MFWITPALNNNLNVDDTSTTFAGVMNGRYKVYVDPYAANVAASQYYVVGYKGNTPYDAGLFYARMFLSRWFVRLVRTHSSRKSGSRLVTAWLLTHLRLLVQKRQYCGNDCAHSECECLLSSGQGYKPYVRIRNLTTNLGGVFGPPLLLFFCYNEKMVTI